MIGSLKEHVSCHDEFYEVHLPVRLKLFHKLFYLHSISVESKNLKALGILKVAVNLRVYDILEPMLYLSDNVFGTLVVNHQ